MATSVKTLVKLANELHTAYTALTEFDNESARLYDASSVLRADRRHRAYQRETLTKTADKATNRLATAIDKTTPERLKEAEKAVGDKVYVFDGF